MLRWISQRVVQLTWRFGMKRLGTARAKKSVLDSDSGKRQVIGRRVQAAAAQRLRRSITAQVAQATHMGRRSKKIERLFHWADLLGPSWGWLLRTQREEF